MPNPPKYQVGFRKDSIWYAYGESIRSLLEMGCDIHITAEKKVEEKWEELDFVPFDWRFYRYYGANAPINSAGNSHMRAEVKLE